MQTWAEDYSVCEINEGCCLNCGDSHPGCLCFECNCTKCYWYRPPEEYDGFNGHCDLTDELKAEKQEQLNKEPAHEFLLKIPKIKNNNQSLKKLFVVEKE